LCLLTACSEFSVQRVQVEPALARNIPELLVPYVSTDLSNPTYQFMIFLNDHPTHIRDWINYQFQVRVSRCDDNDRYVLLTGFMNEYELSNDEIRLDFLVTARHLRNHGVGTLAHYEQGQFIGSSDLCANIEGYSDYGVWFSSDELVFAAALEN